MKTTLLAIVAWFTLAGSLSAQVCESNCSVRFSQPLVVFTDYVFASGGYRLAVNNTYTSQTWAVNGSYIEFPFPQGFPVGSYTFVMEANFGNGWVQLTDPSLLTVQRGKVKYRL